MQTTLENLGPARAAPERRGAARADRRRGREAPRAPRQDRARCRASGPARCRSRWSRSNTARRCARTSSPTPCRQSFNDAVREQNLRVAGYPRIEPAADDRRAADALEFSAVFEVYPEVKLGDVAASTIERPQVEVDAGRRRPHARGAAQAARDVSRRSTRGAQTGDRVNGRLHRHDRRRRVPGRAGARTSRSRSAKAGCCPSSRRRSPGMKAGETRDVPADVSRPTTTARKSRESRRSSR